MDSASDGGILSKRQQCASLIQEIGSRIPTTQVVINAATYYMHNFLEHFSPNMVKPIMVAIASLYLACKTEDFSRKLSLLIGVTYSMLKTPVPPETSPTYRRIVQNIHALESYILMVVGFKKMDVKHPHVILLSVLRKHDFPKHVQHTGYYLCTHMLHFTSLILRHSMEAIAATSLFISAKWNNYEIKCDSGDWWRLFSPDLTLEEIRNMADEFLKDFSACDFKLKNQLKITLTHNLMRQQRIDDPMSQSRKMSDTSRGYSRPDKRPHDSQVASKDLYPHSNAVHPSGNQQFGNINGTNIYDESRHRSKIPRTQSPKSQPPLQNRNQPTFSVPSHPDSATSAKREEPSRLAQSVSASHSVVSSSRASTNAAPKTDLSSLF